MVRAIKDCCPMPYAALFVSHVIRLALFREFDDEPPICVHPRNGTPPRGVVSAQLFVVS